MKKLYKRKGYNEGISMIDLDYIKQNPVLYIIKVIILSIPIIVTNYLLNTGEYGDISILVAVSIGFVVAFTLVIVLLKYMLPESEEDQQN